MDPGCTCELCELRELFVLNLDDEHAEIRKQVSTGSFDRDSLLVSTPPSRTDASTSAQVRNHDLSDQSDH